MRKIYLFLFFISTLFSAQSQVTHVVISQVYGGGGNVSATYDRDYVELFNPTNAAVNLSNYSIQYASATGNTWLARTLSGSIAPKSYFLIQMTNPGTNGAALPTPDHTVIPISDLSATVGKVALVSNITALTGTCPTGGAIVDFVGFGTTANCFEGTGPTPAPSVTSSIFRKNNGCIDTDDNATDFLTGAANPRNSLSPVNNCSSNSITTGTVSTPPFCINATTPGTATVAYTSTGNYGIATFTAYLSNAAGSFTAPVSVGTGTVFGGNPFGAINITIPIGTPSGTGYRIRIDASSGIIGSVSSPFEVVNGVNNITNLTATAGSGQATINWTNPTACFDDVLVVVKAGASINGVPTGDASGLIPSLIYGVGSTLDGGFVVYKGASSSLTITGLTNGTTYYVKIFSRRGLNWSSGVEVTVNPTALLTPGPGDIVINQFSPDYGGSGDEYIELVNKTNNTFDLSGLAIRYQSAGGGGGSAGGALSGSLAGKHFWLLSPNTAITVGQTAGLMRDGAITAGFAAPNGQFALVRVSDDVVIDAVAYGAVTSGNYSEVSAAPAPPTNGGIRRKADGADTDNNLADFTTVDNANILLRNSAGPLLPVKFTSVRAAQKGNGIEVSWSNATEENVINYVIERSADSRNFTTAGQATARLNNGNSAAYSFTDAMPLTGDNYYRIKAIENSGRAIYSNVVRINLAKKGIELTVLPNPVKGNTLHLQVSNLPAGKYSLVLYTTAGQAVNSRVMNHAGGSASETITVDHLNAGLYFLQINGAVRLQKQVIVTE